ncbi:transmembrane protein 230-like [Asterias rubens]|uniref:transmembrane protein 230-like n=1 Tax=Asterias rubens TaxID=7604 RepID=UPI001455AA25|nr:transmembrane protein 230-like [Asterias rubens]
MAKRMKTDKSVKYTRMTDTGDGYIDLQFQRRPLKIPWRSIGVACLLLAMGTTLLTIGALLVSGHIDNKHSDRMWPVLILGMLLFIPGFYHVRLALYAFRGYRGYSFEDIPDYDD